MPAKGKYLSREKASKEKVDGKSKRRSACEEYWKPGSCSQGHNCPKYHPRRQPGRCAICGSTESTRHYTSQCTSPVKPKAKNAEWDESTWQYDEAEWQDSQWKTEEYVASKGKTGKGKGSKRKVKGSPTERMRRDLLLQGHRRLHRREVIDPNPKPNPKHAHA